MQQNRSGVNLWSGNELIPLTITEDVSALYTHLSRHLAACSAADCAACCVACYVGLWRYRATMVVALGLPINGVRPAKTWLAVDIPPQIGS
jgi:hypothetical protein